jgi:uncharacterized protein YndB with AHSA1/START domain
MSRDGILETTPDGGVIRFERHLPHPVEDVWSAITEPAQLAQWWLPMAADISVDLVVGGRMEFRTSGPDAMTMTCTILRLEPPTLLEHTHLDEGSWMRWELAPADGGCVLRLSHVVPDTRAAVDNCYLVGLHESLERLEPCLAGKPEPWDWDRFARSQARYAAEGLAAPVTG